MAVRTATIFGLILALVVPAAVSALRFGSDSLHDAALRTMALDWASVLVLFVLVLAWERRSLDSMGLRRPGWSDLVWGFGGFVAGIAVFGATAPILQAFDLGTTEAGIRRLSELPLAMRLLLIVTAGVTEEILFRGYPIERLIEWTRRPLLSAGIAYAVFVGLHASFWGPGGTLQIAVWSLIVTAIYLRRRNLAPCILMHTLNDAFAFLVLPSLLAAP